MATQVMVCDSANISGGVCSSPTWVDASLLSGIPDLSAADAGTIMAAALVFLCVCAAIGAIVSLLVRPRRG